MRKTLTQNNAVDLRFKVQTHFANRLQLSGNTHPVFQGRRFCESLGALGEGRCRNERKGKSVARGHKILSVVYFYFFGTEVIGSWYFLLFEAEERNPW